MTHAQMFAFESDFVVSLRCIPMAVRFKLDRCGIKLSLRQWSRFTPADRRALLHAAISSDSEVDAYRDALVDVISARSDEPAKALATPPCRSWENGDHVPEVVTAYARSIGLPPPAAPDWARLTELQRFVLVKLTRDNHDNVNFAPAMLEFALVRPVGCQSVAEQQTMPAAA